MNSENGGRSQSRHERGFTLVELMIAMGISLFGLAGILSMYSSMASGSQVIDKGAEGTELCEAMMEELRSLPIDRLEAMAAYGPITGLAWDAEYHDGEATGRNGVVFSRIVQAQSVSASGSLVRLRTVVRWSDDGTAFANAAPETVHELALEMIRTREELL